MENQETIENTNAHKLTLMALVGILFLSVCLNFFNLGAEGLWFDEICTFNKIKMPIAELFSHLSHDKHPPLYYILQRQIAQVVGYSEFSLRLLSAVTGSISIFLIFLLAKSLFGVKSGLCSSFIGSVSVYCIHHARDAKMYSLVLMLSLLSFYFFLKIIGQRKRSNNFWYILSSTALLYTHTYSIFLIISQCIYLIIEYFLGTKKPKSYIKKWVTTELIIFLLFTPWLFVVYRQLMKITHPKIEIVSDFHNIALIDIFNIFNVGFAGDSPYLLIILGTLAAISLLKLSIVNGNMENYYKIENIKFEIQVVNVRKNILLMLWLIVPIILITVASKILKQPLSRRHAIAASVPFYIFAGSGLARIKSKKLSMAILLFFAIASVLNLNNYYSKAHEQWREVASYINDKIQDDEKLFYSAPFYKKTLKYYPIDKKVIVEGVRLYEIKLPELLREQKGRFWLVTMNKPLYQGLQEVMISFDVLEHKAFAGGILVYHLGHNYGKNKN